MFEISQPPKVNDESFEFTESIETKCTSEEELYNTLNEQMYEAKLSPKKKKSVKFNLEIEEKIAPINRESVNTTLQNLFSEPDPYLKISVNNNTDYNTGDCDNNENSGFGDMSVDGENTEPVCETIPNLMQNNFNDSKLISFGQRTSKSHSNDLTNQPTFNNLKNHPNLLGNNIIPSNQQFNYQQRKFFGSKECVEFAHILPNRNSIGVDKMVGDSIIFKKPPGIEIDSCPEIKKSLDETKALIRLNDLRTNFYRVKKSFKLENRKKQVQIDNLNVCIDAQHKTLENYDFMVSSLKYEIETLKSNNEMILNENRQLIDKLDVTKYALEKARIQVDVFNKMKELGDHKVLQNISDIDVSVYTTHNFETLRSVLESLSIKNEYLQEVCMFLTRKFNNMYRYTVAPALFLAQEETTESASAILSFDPKNSVQTVIDSNMQMFQKLYDLSVIADVSNIDDFKLEQNNILNNLEIFFDELNLKIASQLECLIRQRQSL